MCSSAAFPRCAMEWFSENSQLILLFLTAIPVGVFAVIIGASQFIAIPLFQLFFPWMTLGGIVGNLRIGNMVRDAVALIPVRKDIRFGDMKSYLLVMCIGSVIGTLIVVDVSQNFVLPAILLAVVVTEAAPWIGRHVNKSALLGAFFGNGVYYGIIGAGGSVISMAFLRVKYPKDDQIHFVRVHMLLLEFFAFFVSVIAFIIQGGIDWSISLTWGAGAVIGGYIGGKLLVRIGKTSPKSQKFWMRAVAVFAVAVAVWRMVA